MACKVMFITNNYRPYISGVARSVDAYADGLRQLGCDVAIITLSFTADHTDDPSHVYRVPSLARFRYFGNHAAIPWRSFAFIKRRVDLYRPDIIHIHHPFLLGVNGATIAHSLRIPLFFTYHTFYELFLNYLPLPAMVARPLILRAVNNVCRLADRIIAPSEGVAARLAQIVSCDKKITVLPSPIRSELLATGRGFYKRSAKQCHLLSVGRLGADKNTIFLIDAYLLLPRERYILTIVGDGYEREKLETYARSLGISDQYIKFTGVLEGVALQVAYQNAHIFLFPSHNDAQGLVIAEAMSAGLPVVAVDGPGSRDIIVDGENGLIVTSRLQMALSIRNIWEGDSYYASYSGRAMATAERYKIDPLSRKLLSLYETSLGLR